MRDDRMRLVADDYGLAPGVSAAIRELIVGGRITGTGCMTLFPEWDDEAPSIRAVAEQTNAEIGLHLTLTDFKPLSGQSPLGSDHLPPLSKLIVASYLGRGNDTQLFAELDAQLQAFVGAMGRMPDYLDGHQHVHFLPPVRRWLLARRGELGSSGRLPWLRGAPNPRFAPGLAIRAKVAFVRLLARSFDRQMRAAGFPVHGPLAGFYDWTNPKGFAAVLRAVDGGLPEGAVVMCHPGRIDAMLKSRDRLVDARAVEFDALSRRPPFVTGA